MIKTIDEMVAVMLAARDGKKIQFLAIRDSEGRSIPNMEWMDGGSNPFCWDWARFDYRIKPEPRRVYISEYQNGELSINAYPAKLDAEVVGKKSTKYVRTITFVEEIE